MAKRYRAEIEVADMPYILELDRDAIVYTEEILGFKLAEYELKPYASMYKLFAGGLHKNHAELSIDERADLLDKYEAEGGDIEEVLGFLLNAYAGFKQTTQKPTKKLKLI